jgi:type IV pilus assembly protein PilE
VTRERGYTVFSILVAFFIVAIIAAFAVNGYQDSVRRSRRAEARIALMSLALEQEKLRTSCASYAANIGKTSDCAAATVRFVSLSETGLYALSITDATPTGFTALAQARQAQASDSDCLQLKLVVERANIDRSPQACR